jgi:hypothetical protein
MAADPLTEIADRPIPQEPMVTANPLELPFGSRYFQYLIANLGISPNFATVDTADLVFPTTLRIDWIRVYQPKNAINIGCDPQDFPTSAYINEYAPIFPDTFFNISCPYVQIS